MLGDGAVDAPPGPVVTATREVTGLDRVVTGVDVSPLCAAVLPVEMGVVSTLAVGGGVLLAREGADVASVGVGDADVSDLPGDVWPPLAGDGVLLCPEVGDACEEAPVGVGPPGDEEGADVLTAAVALPGPSLVGPTLGLGGCWEGVAVC